MAHCDKTDTFFNHRGHTHTHTYTLMKCTKQNEQHRKRWRMEGGRELGMEVGQRSVEDEREDDILQ